MTEGNKKRMQIIVSHESNGGQDSEFILEVCLTGKMKERHLYAWGVTESLKMWLQRILASLNVWQRMCVLGSGRADGDLRSQGRASCWQKAPALHPGLFGFSNI